MIALDTHAVVWLHVRAGQGIPAPVVNRLDAEVVHISAPARLELSCLHEIGRLADTPAAVLRSLATRLDLAHETISAQALFEAAVPLTWPRDLFDRLICAHAAALGIDLATKDTRIRAHFPRAVWDDAPA